MRDKFDVIVIGGGVHGAAIFYHLTKTTGKSIALLEKNQFCHGATGSSGGFIRALHPSALFTELAWQSIADFNDFENNLGLPCDFVKTGYYTIEKISHIHSLQAQVQWLQQQGSAIRCFSADEVGSLPAYHLVIHSDEMIIYEPEAGYANPRKTTHAYIDAAVDLGGVALENTEVNQILAAHGKVAGVKTTAGVFEAPCIVLTAGTGCLHLLTQLGVHVPKLSHQRITVDYYQYPAKLQKMPSFFDKVNGLYGRDDGSDQCLLGTTTCQPASDSSTAGPAENLINPLLKHSAEQRIPYFNQMNWQNSCQALDVYTSNGQAITEFVKELPGLFLCTGWNGAGFKLAPESARRVAAAVRLYMN